MFGVFRSRQSVIVVLSVVVCSLLFCSLPLVLADVVCLNDWDCSLGGLCNQSTGQCDCDIHWTGPTCAQLNLQPASRINGFNLAVNTTTWSALPPAIATHTWCTSIHYDNTSNDYFAAISYITNHCTLDDWTTNSQVVTVRSKSPFGPFDPSTMTVVVPAFAHNPKVVRYVDGMWLLFFIGSVDGHIQPNNCTSSADTAASSPSSSRSSSYFSAFDPTAHLRSPAVDPGNDGPRVAWSYSSHGPWTLHNKGAPLFGPNSSAWYSRVVTNPAPVILPNGTTLLYFTASPDLLRGPHSSNTIAVARAPHWTGPYTVVDVWGGVTAPDAEDSFVFRDARGRYHMLVNTNTCHWQSGNMTGYYTGHSWSEDGLVWSRQYLGSATTTVHFDDGSTTVFSYRERPDLYLDGEGRPVAFASGMTGVDGYSDSFSFVQPVCTDEKQLCYGGIDLPKRRVDEQRLATAAD